MAGHSQYKNIMHRKGRQDAAKAKLFSKLAREITVAAKTGTPDPGMNARLRLAIQAARAENMPKDNIERAIKKAAGGDADTYEAIRYEGYAPGGVAVIAEALTDNRNRTGGAVRAVFTKYGGNLGSTGSVAHMFTHAGEITYPVSAGTADAVLDAAIEAGADDVHSDADGHVIACAFDSLGTVAGALEAALGEAKQRQGGVEAQPVDGSRRGERRERHEDDRRARGRRRRAERLRQLRGVRGSPEEAHRGVRPPRLPPRNAKVSSDATMTRSPVCHPRAGPEDPGFADSRVGLIWRSHKLSSPLATSVGLGPRTKSEDDT